MAELVADCPRCRSRKITFEVMAAISTTIAYGWQIRYEAFGICRRCSRATIFVLKDHVDADHKEVHKIGLLKMDRALNEYVTIEGFVNLSDMGASEPPEHLPEAIAQVFGEGAKCLAIGCANAAATMFRMCLDLATRHLLPAPDAPGGPNGKQRRDLGLRLPWLFENNLIPAGLHDLASCIKEDGNDGAHAGTISKADAEDVLDFTYELLERLYTEPRRLQLAAERRAARRIGPGA